MRFFRLSFFAIACLAATACDVDESGDPSINQLDPDFDPDFEPDAEPVCGDAETFWVDVKEGATSFVDGSTLDFSCGGQGGVMLMFDAEFGGVGIDTQVNLTVDVEGMTGEPLYQGSHPVEMSCEGAPATLEIVSIVPDDVNPWALQGSAVTLRFEVPLGGGEFAVREVSGFLGVNC